MIRATDYNMLIKQLLYIDIYFSMYLIQQLLTNHLYKSIFNKEREYNENECIWKAFLFISYKYNYKFYIRVYFGLVSFLAVMDTKFFRIVRDEQRWFCEHNYSILCIFSAMVYIQYAQISSMGKIPKIKKNLYLDAYYTFLLH